MSIKQLQQRTAYGLVALLLAIGLTACGSDTKKEEVKKPVAVATAQFANNSTFAIGSLVQLNGNTSTAGENGQLTYQWELVTKPTYSEAKILEPNRASTSFYADLPGEYLVNLLVIESNNVVSDPVTLKFRAINTDPTAIAQTQLFRLKNSYIELDGRQSQIPEGGDASKPLTYEWTLSAPQSANVPELYNPDRSIASFSAYETGMYIAKLVVEHDGKRSKPLVITIVVNEGNVAPEINVGEGPFEGVRGSVFTLNGVTVTDDNGDALVYRWRFGSKPVGSNTDLAIQNADTLTPSFVPDMAGYYELQLDAFDGKTTSTNSVGITITKPEGAANQPPVITGIYFPMSGGLEMEWDTQSTPTLYYNDPDGTAGLSIQWTLLDVTPANITLSTINAGNWSTQQWTKETFQSYLDTRANRNSLYGLHVNNPGQQIASVEIKLRVAVTDSDGASDSKEFTIRVLNGANTRPTAVIESYSSVTAGTAVQLDGRKSTDPEQNRMTFAWKILEQPVGSQAALTNATGDVANFNADRAGNYRVQLIVTDEHGLQSTPQIATISAKPYGNNTAPFGRWLDAFSNAFIWERTSLTRDDQGIWHYQLGNIVNKYRCSFDYGWDGKSSSCDDHIYLEFNAYDQDGDRVAYDIVAQAPTGSGLNTSYSGLVQHGYDSAVAQKTVLTLDKITTPGDYQFTLQLVDGSNASSPETLQVKVADFPAGFSALELWYAPFSCRGTSLAHGYPCTGKADGSDLTVKRYFPAATLRGPNVLEVCSDNFSNNCYQTWKNGGVKQYFKLKAVGKDFTLKNVKLEARDDGGYNVGNLLTQADGYGQPRFVGISEGTVVRAGESIIFGVELPALPAATANETSYWYTWAFEIPELGEDGVFKREQEFRVPAAK